MSEQQTFAADGVLQEKITYRYDAAGLETEQNLFSISLEAKEMQLLRKRTREYDAQGRLVEETDSTGTPRVRHWTYDTYGNWLTMPEMQYQSVAYREITFY